MRLSRRPRNKYGAGFEDKQQFCASCRSYFMHVPNHFSTPYTRQYHIERLLGGCPRIEAYCGKADFGPFFRLNSFNTASIRLIESKKWTQNRFPSLRPLFADSLPGYLISGLKIRNA
jgi:hypothetical protein